MPLPARITVAFVACCLALFSASGKADEQTAAYPDRWVWVMSNLLVDEQAEFVSRLIERSARAGYNGLALADYKLNLLEQMPERYFKNVARVQAVAAANHIEIIPCLFPIGRRRWAVAS